jgi:AGZA family xanthine/uracil permease-like MFS transporter
MGEGSILSGLVLAAVATFVIEREFARAAAFALAGAVLTYFRFMHGPAVGVGNGFGVTPQVALAYGVVAAFLYGCALMKTSTVEGRTTSSTPEPVRAMAHAE